MTKKFELSAYGMEEMNQKELVDVEGGLVWAWLLAFIAEETIDEALTRLTGHGIGYWALEGVAASASAAAYARDGCHYKR